MADSTQIIGDRKVVRFHYTLTDDAGRTLDSSRGGAPLPYLHGQGQIVPGLERAMTGRQTGDRFKVDVAPADGYGERVPLEPQPVPREQLPQDVDIVPGMQFVAEMPDGRLQPLWVTRVEAGQVYLDPNHPLAGQTLHFDVEVTEVRDATDEELAHGHPHGPDGHHHH